jgi:hypothetical protein
LIIARVHLSSKDDAHVLGEAVNPGLETRLRSKIVLRPVGEELAHHSNAVAPASSKLSQQVMHPLMRDETHRPRIVQGALGSRRVLAPGKEKDRQRR